jgi:prepilin peptidase CpaA
MDSTAPHLLHIVAFAVSLSFVWALLDAASSDAGGFRIANRVPLLLLAGFPLVGVLEGFAVQDWLVHAGVGFALFAAGAALFAFRLWGGGDAKMVAAVGLWLGLGDLPRFLLVMSVVGGGLAIVALAARLSPVPTAGPLGAWRQRLARTRHIPYGLAIAAAGLDWWIGAARSQIWGIGS